MANQAKSPHQEPSPAGTLISDFWASEQCEINLCCLNHSVCGILLWQPELRHSFYILWRNPENSVSTSLCARRIVRPNRSKRWSLEQKKRFMAGPCKEIGGSCLKNIPNSPNQNCKAFLKIRRGEGCVGCCNLAWEFFVLAAVHRGQGTMCL